MKPNYRLLVVLLLSLPLVLVAVAWNRLPDRFPMHFNADQQPDHFGNRQEWLLMLLSSLFLLSLMRSVMLSLIARRGRMPPIQRRALSLLTAGFVAGSLSLLIAQGLLSAPVYTNWLPVLVALLSSGFVYFSVTPTLPAKAGDAANGQPTQQSAALQHSHTLSRLVVVRVNLLAALVMIFADRSDRWTIAILANVLAYVFLFIATATLLRNNT